MAQQPSIDKHSTPEADALGLTAPPDTNLEAQLLQELDAALEATAYLEEDPAPASSEGAKPTIRTDAVPSREGPDADVSEDILEGVDESASGDTLGDDEQVTPKERVRLLQEKLRAVRDVLNERVSAGAHGSHDDAAPDPSKYEKWPAPLRKAKLFLDSHGHLLWWLHSIYALALGTFVMIFAQKGFDYVRLIAPMVAATWLVIMLLFRFLGSGREQKLKTQREKVQFLVMTYVLKNLFQGMLFFLLPFYWKATTFDSSNRWFVILLMACALLATLDVVFDRVLMYWRSLAAVYNTVALFAGLNLAIPALFPMPALWGLMIAAGIAMIAFWTLNVELQNFKERRYQLRMGLSMLGALTAAFLARGWIPPVPLALGESAVGPEVLEDGRLAMHVTSLDTTMMHGMIAVTELRTPAGFNEDFVHVWRREGEEVLRLQPELQPMVGSKTRFLMRSELKDETLPPLRHGEWSVDVETADGQLIGRVYFVVTH